MWTYFGKIGLFLGSKNLGPDHLMISCGQALECVNAGVPMVGKCQHDGPHVNDLAGQLGFDQAGPHVNQLEGPHVSDLDGSGFQPQGSLKMQLKNGCMVWIWMMKLHWIC
jgi:hypothetical protein